jgi:nucleoside-diphosphate-sugar epimerase
VEEVVNYLISFARIKPKLIYTNEYRQGEVLDVIADTRRAKVGLLWEPRVDFKEGIAEMVKGL